MSSPDKHRRNTDVNKLMESKHDVTILGGLDEIVVKFYGPEGTPYEGGVWEVQMNLPEEYPFKAPRIRFLNKIFHPNISEMFGNVCLDVINQGWTEKYNLIMIFDYFLPQLLAEPNPTDPLNLAAAMLYLDKPEEFKEILFEHMRRHATEEALQPEATESKTVALTDSVFFLH